MNSSTIANIANPVSTLPQRNAFIVDDEKRFRSLISKVVVGMGFTPHEFSKVTELEVALTRIHPDVIILDLSLGGSDAIEVMRSLAEAQFRGEVLLVSGHDEGTLGEVQSIGARLGLTMLGYLRKPIGIAELRGRLSGMSAANGIRVEDADLLSGLKHNWLDLCYQPKIDLTSMRICGAEALVRLKHPEHGILAPAAFLPPPGDPLYKPLTDFVVRRARSDWSCFPDADGPIRLAINVPASILQRPDFVPEVRRHLPSRAGFPGLIVEITEDEALSDPKAARDVAVQLKLYNIHVSIDDFGTGYSSMLRLNELSFAELKLDRKFVAGCSSDAGKQALCKSVVDLAHRFDLIAVAEGVETESDLRALVGMGCDLAQGFLFGKAMEVGDFVKLLSG